MFSLNGHFSSRNSAYSVREAHSSHIPPPFTLCLARQYFLIITGMSFFSFSHALSSSGVFRPVLPNIATSSVAYSEPIDKKIKYAIANSYSNINSQRSCPMRTIHIISKRVFGVKRFERLKIAFPLGCGGHMSSTNFLKTSIISSETTCSMRQAFSSAISASAPILVSTFASV